MIKKDKITMSQRNLVLLTTAVLLAVIGGVGIYKHQQQTPKPTAANAIVSTGVSVNLSDPLSTDAQLKVEDANGKQVLSRKLEAKAQLFNVALAPGIYKVTITQDGLSPFTVSAVAVSEGRLTQLHAALPHGEDEVPARN